MLNSRGEKNNKKPTVLWSSLCGIEAKNTLFLFAPQGERGHNGTGVARDVRLCGDDHDVQWRTVSLTLSFLPV